MTLLSELDKTIEMLEAEIPASPARNINLEQRLQKELANYFRALDQAMDWNALEQLYYKNVKVEEAMTPADWKRAYAKGTPHWAEDIEPSQFAKDFIKLMKSYKVKSVLEIGCGNGRDSIYFVKQGFKVTSIDIVQKAIDLANKNAVKAKTEVNFKVASAEKLPFEDSEFGSIFTLSVLHSTNLKKSLPEVYRVLKVGGVAFIYIYGDTQFESGKTTEDTISYSDFLDSLTTLGFKVLESYKDNEKEFDDYGEKHHIYVTYLEKIE